jgi:carbon-monoxide dehydrogenase small subunit
MTVTTFVSATTVEEALQALAAGARPVAGGTDLVVADRSGKAALPESLVAIHRIAELRGVTAGADGLRLGALASHAEVAADAEVRARYTALADACAIVGSHATRAQGKPVNSCSYLALQADGSEVTTVEGPASDDTLAPLQAAFLELGGVQCGFCTPGMLISAAVLLAENPSPTEDEVRIGLSGNLCRCTGYDGIVKAVLSVAEAC